MIRRPPRSTLFPYTDALPISRLLLSRANSRSPCTTLISTPGWLSVAVEKISDFRVGIVVLRGIIFVATPRSEEHTSELQSRQYLVCRHLLAHDNERSIGARPC